MPTLRSVSIPVIAIIGDGEEYTVLPIKEALDLIRKENPGAEIVQISNCDHDFSDREEELSEKLLIFFDQQKIC